MCRGTHAKSRQTTTGRATRRAAAAFLVTLAVYAVRTAAAQLGRAAVTGWRRLPPPAKVITGTVGAFVTAELAASVKMIPDTRWWVLLTGGAFSVFYGGWLIAWQRVGQREWREHGPALVNGSSGEWRVHTQRSIVANAERLDALEREVAMLRRIVSAVGGETGVALPGEMAPRRHLRAVGDDSGPLPRIS